MNPNDLAADCVGLDGSETITVSLRRAEGVTNIVVPSALRRSMTRSTTVGGGVTLPGDDVVWNIPQSSLGNERDVRPGDSISTGEEAWVILVSRIETLGCRWRCICRREP